VQLTWTAATDNVGVASYDIYRDGTLLQSTGATTSASDPTVSPGASYSYVVRARDAAGNVSGPSNAVSVTVPTQQSGIFSDGFESGNLSGWTSASSGMAVQGVEVRSGARAARATGSGATTAYARKTLASSSTALYYRAWFKVLSQGGTVDLLKLQTSAGGSVITLLVSSAGSLMVDNDGQGTNVWSPVVVSKGVWHQAQLHVTINGSASQVEVWLDGTRISQLSVTQSLGSTPIGRLVLGNIPASRAYDIAFDDVAASTAYLS
jgi:hypothetical protein